MKNIVAIKERILFHMDRTRSARYDNERINHAIQVATDDLVKDRYDNIKRKEVDYAFESVQRIRDEIRTIVKIASLTPDAQKVATLPADYMYDVGVKQKIGGVWRNSVPKTISERIGGERNYYGRATFEYPTHEQIDDEIRCYQATGTLTEIELYYIRKYDAPEISDTTITAGVNVLTAGVTYHVEIDTVTNDGTTYQVTDTFTATAADLDLTGAGTVRPIVDMPLPEATHEEIAKRAAGILSGVVENFNRNQLKDIEVKQQ